MTFRRSLLGLAALAAGTFATPDRADAFGPVCVPHIYNCFCTYVRPCPVTDAASNAQKLLSNDMLKQGLELYQGVKNPQDAILKAVTGQGSMRIPGLGSIGINESLLGGIDPGSLGLDPEVLKGLASGTLPAGALSDMASRAGIDPSAIVVPGIDGPLSIPGGRFVSPGDLVNVPLDQIPGLEGLLAGAQTPDGSDAGTSGATDSAAMCTGTGSLISVTTYPHDFIDDVAAIDYFITGGGDLDAYDEGIGDGMTVAQDAIILGLGRSVQARHLLPAALESVATFQTMMDEAQTLQDDFAVNDAINTQLLAARAETASLMTSLASVRASRNINRTTVSPVPLLPHDSQFQTAMEERIAAEARHTDNARATRELAKDHAEFVRSSRQAILHHNLLVDAKAIENTLPGVIATIDEHEARKALLVQIEGVIYSGLAGLYQDPQAAWDVLRPQLVAGAGSYVDTNKWSDGRRLADRLSSLLEAQRPHTAYGARLRNSGGWRNNEGTEPPYSVIGELPSQLGLVSRHFGDDDPYRISGGRSGNRDGFQDYGDAFVPVLQVYVETLRRTDFQAGLRRGGGHQTMSGDFWSEMINFAPECLSGPVPFSPEAIAARPDLFDLSKSCTHLTWTGGDTEDYISPSSLGGADAALWLSKISLDKVRNRTGGPEVAAAIAQSVIDYERGRSIAGRADELGLPSTASHTRRIVTTLDRAVRDTSLAEKLDFPREE